MTAFLNTDSKNFVKVVAYSSDKGVVVALCRGDREIEETKIKNSLTLNTLEMATAEQIASIGSVPGYIGAIDLKDCIVIADNDIKYMTNFVIGANLQDYHYVNANLEDLKIDCFADIKKARAGDKCPRCGGTVKVVRGIEVGHIFKLGTRYTKALDCKFLDEQGKSQYMIMGCYGIGVSRTLSALVEQNCDDKGIVWPEIVAPYKLEIVIANTKDQEQVKLANDLYQKLNSSDDVVLLDDRNESFGVKLNDAELIGVPYIVIVGRGAKENKIEFIQRKTMNKLEVSVDEFLNSYVNNL